MSAYYDSLNPVFQQRLAPFKARMEAAANRHNIPVDLLYKTAVNESGGDAKIVGDKSLAAPAYGLYQVRDRKYWLSGADPLDPYAATDAIAPRLAQLLKECGGDQACVRFKYMAGPGQAYTPQNVARISAKFTHVSEQLRRFGGDGAKGGTPTPQQIERMATMAPAPVAGYAPLSADAQLGLVDANGTGAVQGWGTTATSAAAAPLYAQSTYFDGMRAALGGDVKSKPAQLLGFDSWQT